MAKSFPINRIRTHLVYTVWEVADLLGCHRQTVIRWINDKGLEAEQSHKPWLIEGRALKAFLGARDAGAKCKLELHHCYCLGCKGPREPDAKIADFTLTSPRTGMLTALCPTCGSLMNKVVRRVELEAIRAKIEVTIQQAIPRLVSLEEPHSNVTFKMEA